MSYQMTGPEDDPTSPWDYLKFGLGAMAPDNAGPFLRDNLGLGLSSDAPAPAPAPVQDGMAGWASPPDQGGLGMRGQSDAAPAGSGMNWVDALKGIGGALEGFSAGFHGRTPLFVKMQELDQQQQLRRDALAQQQQARRDTIKQQMAQLEEQRQQHYRDMTMKMVESGNYEGLKMLGEQYKYAPAVNLAQGLAQSDLSRLPGLMEKGYLTQDDVDAAFSSDPTKRLGPNAIRARVKLADQMDMEDEKANAKQAFVRNALNIRDQGKPLTAAQERAIQENETNLQLTDAKRREAEATATLKEVQAENEWLNYGKNPQEDKGLGHDREAFTQQFFGRGMQYKSLSPPQMERVNNAIAEFQGKISGQRTANVQNALDQVPVGRTGKSQEYRDPVTGKAAPSWASPAQLQAIGAVNIEPSQANVIAQATTIDQLLREIMADGSTLTRQETGASLADVTGGLLQTPINKLLRKYSGDPAAARLQSALTRIGPMMGRMAGDTHISNVDSQSYKDAIFSDSDTIQSLMAKVKSVHDAQQNVKRSMGFLSYDDPQEAEAAYIRQLVLRGLSDSQVKAAVQERKRMFQ